MTKQPPPKNSDPDSTRIDLGDDLLEKTDASSRVAETSSTTLPQASPNSFVDAPITPDQVEDRMHSARILVSENFLEEAKKILHRIMIVDPGYTPARKLLEEIHETELKQIFGEGEALRTARPLQRLREEREEGFGRAPGGAKADERDAEEVLRELDRDLKLGIFEEIPGESAASEAQPGNETSPLFFAQDAKAMEEYAARLEESLGALPARDRVDLGIGFLEMGLPVIAIRQFKAACNALLRDSAAEVVLPEEAAEGARLTLLSATALLAHAFIAAGRPFDATLVLQAVLRDSEVKTENKLEFFYQMGRAYEAMRKHDLAEAWYRQVQGMDPQYRDVAIRLRARGAGKPAGKAAGKAE